MEASAEKQVSFQAELATIDPKKIVYLDQSGVDQTLSPLRGWSKRGAPCPATKPGIRGKRTHVIGALAGKKALAIALLSQACNSTIFLRWLKDRLLPRLSPGHVLVLDNARFHHANAVKVLVQSFGCRLLFLPPYSPELNPIEKTWANLKNWLRKNKALITDIPTAIGRYFVSPCKII